MPPFPRGSPAKFSDRPQQSLLAPVRFSLGSVGPPGPPGAQTQCSPLHCSINVFSHLSAIVHELNLFISIGIHDQEFQVRAGRKISSC